MKFVNYSNESVFKPFQKFRTKSFENNRDNRVTYRTNHISRMSAQQTVKRIAKKNCLHTVKKYANFVCLSTPRISVL